MKCTGECQLEKDESEFSIRTGSVKGFASRCKECTNKKYRVLNPKKVKEKAEITTGVLIDPFPKVGER